jgi:enoyl-CoA hydratase/carnithine racemase
MPDKVLWLKLTDRVHYCEENLNIRAMFLTGSGKAFCSGGDLLEVGPTKSQGHYVREHLLQRSFGRKVLVALRGAKHGF